jgi:glycosyltransferase involved in cell wall biosynthesis
VDPAGLRTLGRSLGGFMVKPSVTVLMPVYNTLPELLDQAIGSVLAQTFTDFELLIVDDGSSSQSTLETLQRALQRDRRVRVSHQRHLGLTPSLNVGLRLAAGDLIARQDSDDWSDRERLDRQVTFLRSHPGIAVVGCAVWMHQHGGKALWKVEFPLTPADIDRSFWTRNPFVHGAAMFRREEALKTGGYREALRCSQDYDFFWRLSEWGKGANLPEALYHYRFTAGSVSAAKAAEQALAHRAARLLAAARQRGEQENVAEAIRTAGAAAQADSAFRALLKQADHLMLAGEFGASARAYLRLLGSRPSSALAWGKLLRLGVFQTLPAARKACFR